ncbi:DNA polymerase III subunit delta' [Terricaulis silvestris]|uniref:DNA polymerase III subunit tau n=1 Tax=Terricaulis silvestris TaxID=2686094 RepID=A0A6I6MTZ8_9CAUL|nr:DNA polymerase III subunit delta' [Terricaulis silvestris]QGZ95132.1 DNA polymerase III subunit tau [Terricaulis silvestris]
MKAEKAAPETDKEPEAPHPRETFSFVGHDAEEQALRDALHGARMHHAWLLAGAKGLGKATLAYRFARIALGAKQIGARPLDVDPEDQVARRIAAQSHPDLFILRRGLNDRGKPRREIAVDDARELGQFFSLAPSEGGMRIAIIDAADDLNNNSANAILKTLEEPPARSVLLLVCHAPGAILPTIRSRCRRLALRPVSDDLVRQALGGAKGDDALIDLAKGRPGRAIALKAQGLDAGSADLRRAPASIARGEAASVLNPLYDQMSGEPFERLAAVLELAEEWTRAQGAGEGGEPWAEAWSQLETLRTEAEGLDMDPRHALARAVGVLDRAAAARR